MKKVGPLHRKKWLIALLSIVAVLVVFGGAIAIAYQTKHTGDFSSLKHIAQYAGMLEEYPTIDNTNWYRPDYTSHYKDQLIGLFDRILIALHIKHKPIWDITLFNDLVTRVGEDRQSRHLSGACTQGIMPQKDDRFFLWTDMQGAFHSLVRCLEFLHDNHVIADDLTLQEHCYFVFNGDVLSHGPYILQTLTLILQLMEKNPERVLYIRSYQEQPGVWYDAAFARALQVFDTADEDEIVPSSREVDAFLETLPDALYLLQKEEGRYQAVEITSALDTTDSFIHKCSAIMILHLGKESVSLSYDAKGFINDVPLNVRALVVHPDSPKYTAVHPEGITPVGLQDTTFKWVTFSSPIARSHQIYHFFYDTIIEITTPGPIDTWVISEQRNDVRNIMDFEFASSYYLVSGMRPGDKERIAKLEEQIAQTKRELEAARRACAQE